MSDTISENVKAAAVCSIGNYEYCQWTQSGTEAEMTEAAGRHAADNPGHRVTCQVRQTRTWTVTIAAASPAPERG